MTASPTLTCGQRLELDIMALIVVTPHLINFASWFSIFLPVVLLCYLWRAWQKKPLLPRIWIWLLAGLSAWIVYFEFNTLLGRDGGLAILISLFCFKLFESRTRRDGRQLILLALFCTGTQFLHDQNPLMMLSALAGIAAITLCGMRIEHPSGYFRSQGKTVIRMLLEALPIALLLFVLFPRLPSPLWRVPAESQASSGLSDKALDPGSISKLALDESVAFRAEFSGSPPDRNAMYWRGPVFGQFDGRRWLGAEPDLASANNQSLQPLSYPVDYTITLEPHQQRWMLALDLPVTIPQGARISSAGQILSEQNIAVRTVYSLRSSLQWRTVELGYPAEQLQLPQAGNPRTREYARTLQKLPPRQRVLAALQWLKSGNFRYTLSPPLLTSQDSIDEFLFESKRGFCEHYAGSFAVLMRAAGVPARIITGYQGGERNETGNYYIIRQADAHAWVEVWLADEGWQRVDPTAIIAPARIDSGLAESLPSGTPLPLMLQSDSSWLKSLRMQNDALMYLWNRWVVEYDAKRQLDLLRRMQIPDIVSWQFLLILVGGLSLLLFFAYASVVWQKKANIKVSREILLYVEFCKILAKKCLARHPNEGPDAFAQRAIETWPEAGRHIRQFIDGYIECRYGKGADEELLANMAEQLRRLRRMPYRR
ncbi:transglutaminase TgpA family protein [Chitinilyticum aquatile]|uniref:transglutaminase TgpA family protein n=1 Tax=Chitinilyticum aquatile TaxID=362520 RepID=UPI0009D6BE78|nr:DUF3488 and transglutaminase-like domain-containing protein [Chitinilyticum aquatile]